MADPIPYPTAAHLITHELAKLETRVQRALLKYCEERDYQKLRPSEMASNIVIPEVAVSMTELINDLRESLEGVLKSGGITKN